EGSDLWRSNCGRGKYIMLLKMAGALLAALLVAAALRWEAAAPGVPLTPSKAEPVGPGGGGALFWPAVSPHDPKLMFVSCDMNGFYRSEDGGASWTMVDGRQMHAN